MALGPAFSSDLQAFGLKSDQARWNEWHTRYREITTDDLRAAGIRGELAARFTVGLNFAMKKFEINTTARQAAFLANVAVETKDPIHPPYIPFTSIEESEYPYSINVMIDTFNTDSHTVFPDAASIISVLKNPHDFQNSHDKKNVADPVKLFNRAYSGRLGNVPHTNDGYTYRGRGVLGLTGRGRYLACGMAIGVDLVGNPEKVADPFYGCLAGAWAWCQTAFDGPKDNHRPRNLNLIADLDTPEAFDHTCAGVNAGHINAIKAVISLAPRQRQWPKFHHALHQRDLRLFHSRMAGVAAPLNTFDDFNFKRARKPH
jgi:putative chitinase